MFCAILRKANLSTKKEKIPTYLSSRDLEVYTCMYRILSRSLGEGGEGLMGGEPI